MGLLDFTAIFKKKPKIVKEIDGAAYGWLVRAGYSSDDIYGDIRCVNKAGVKEGVSVDLLRIFSLSDSKRQGIEVDCWETFDQHPELILFEGYLGTNNKAHLEKPGSKEAC